MNDLFDEIEQEKAAFSEPRASSQMVALLDSMTQEDRETLLNVLRDRSTPHKVIYAVLSRNGYRVSYEQVRRFRTGQLAIPDRYKTTEVEDK